MSNTVNDITRFDSTALLVKVSELGKDIDENSKKLLKYRFENSRLLSDKMACHAYALLNKWYTLATSFIIEINAVKAEGGTNA